MNSGDHNLIRILSLLVALLGSQTPALAEYSPGSTVDFGQRAVGTSTAEIEVVKVVYLGGRNTVAVTVSGPGFARGPSSTCPTFHVTINADCIVTVIFAPASAGLKQGTVRATFGLCPGCPDQTWSLKGTGVLPPPTGPAAPTQLRAETVSFSQITLAWNDNSTNETGFYIERSLSSTGPFTRIHTTNVNVTGYLDSMLDELTTYYYRVQAFRSGGSSGYSNLASAATPSSNVISDTAPPQLMTFSFSPSTINVTSGAQPVTVTARVTDNLSGTSFVQVGFQNPSGLQGVAAALPRISGTPLDGIYQGTVSIPQFGQAGIWKVWFVLLEDFGRQPCQLNLY